MDFSLNDEQKALVQAAADFSHAELADHAARWDADSFFPIDTIRRAGDAGLLGIYVPEERGGLGLSLSCLLLWPCNQAAMTPT